MASIRIKDDGSAPISAGGREAPFKQGDSYVLDVPDDIARYWNKMDATRREAVTKQSRKENRDVRDILDSFVHKPAKHK